MRGDLEPRWSPDGNWIVFQHGDPNGLLTLWVMRRGGSHSNAACYCGGDY